MPKCFSPLPAACTALFVLSGIASGEPAARSIGWSSVPDILERIQAPKFPGRNFPVTKFGAVGDGQTDCTGAIQQAIEACHSSGGGRVLIAGGTFLTGAVHLKSNVDLHVAEGATLLFDPDPSKYPIVFTRWEGIECMNYSPLIYAFEQRNIAITGRGTLDGGASFDNWWSWGDKRSLPVKQQPARARLFLQGEDGVPVARRIYGEGDFLRPNFIQLYRCSNILIDGISMIRSPMWVIHPVLSQNITVRNVKVISHGPNNDGVDPESCRDVLIENTSFDTGDDCISIKSGRNNDGRRIAVPSKNIIIRNCSILDGHGGIVIGSEISGGASNVFAENCTMDSPNLDRAIRFKSNAHRGGVMENVFVRNVRIGRVSEAILTIDFLYEEGADGPGKPVVRNVWLENITSTSSPRVMWIDGFAKSTIEGVVLKNCDFRGVEAAEVMSFAGSVSFVNVTIEPRNKGRSLNSPTVAAPVGQPMNP